MDVEAYNLIQVIWIDLEYSFGWSTISVHCCSEKVSHSNLPWITRKKLPSACNLTCTENFLKNYLQACVDTPEGTVRNIAGRSVQPRYDVTTHIPIVIDNSSHISKIAHTSIASRRELWTLPSSSSSLRISLYLAMHSPSLAFPYHN